MHIFTIGLSAVCIATVFVPKVESGERADVPKVELGEQRVNWHKDTHTHSHTQTHISNILSYFISPSAHWVLTRQCSQLVDALRYAATDAATRCCLGNLQQGLGTLYNGWHNRSCLGRLRGSFRICLALFGEFVSEVKKWFENLSYHYCFHKKKKYKQ